jgi:hypothetical protein
MFAHVQERTIPVGWDCSSQVARPMSDDDEEEKATTHMKLNLFETTAINFGEDLLIIIHYCNGLSVNGIKYEEFFGNWSTGQQSTSCNVNMTNTTSVRQSIGDDAFGNILRILEVAASGQGCTHLSESLSNTEESQDDSQWGWNLKSRLIT